MNFIILIISLLATLAHSQTTQQTLLNQPISLDPNGGNLKLRIVFQAPDQQQQQSPCSTGNCQIQQQQQPTVQVSTSNCATGNCGNNAVQQSPCATGNCQGPVVGSANIGRSYDPVITTSTYAPIPATAQPIYSPPIKVIRVPSYSSSSSGCFSPPCGAPRIVYAAPSPCSGYSCGSGYGFGYQRFFSPRFFNPRPRHHHIRTVSLGSRSNSNSNIAVPDTIFRNGQAIRAPVRVPSSYQDGNPVFNIGK